MGMGEPQALPPVTRRVSEGGGDVTFSESAILVRSPGQGGSRFSGRPR